MLFVFKSKNVRTATLLASCYFSMHVCLAIAIGPFFGFALDESAYLYTFENLYNLNVYDFNPQYQSGWIAAPLIFLQLIHLPALVLTTLGLPSFLALRILSSIAISITFGITILFALNVLHEKSSLKYKFNFDKLFVTLICLAYLIPSFFLWTTLGLREVFIHTFLTWFFISLHKTSTNKISNVVLRLSLPLFGLLCTKAYIFAMVGIAVTLSLFLLLVVTKNLEWRLIVIGISSLLLPVILYATTANAYALNFILHPNKIEEVGSRSGDSVAEINYVDPVNKSIEVKLIQHGDTTLLSFAKELSSNPDSNISKIMRTTKADKFIQEKFDFVVSNLLKAQHGPSNSLAESETEQDSLNQGHILNPGKLDNPKSLIKAVFVFLFNPLPFSGSTSFQFIASFETIPWWLFFILFFSLLFNVRKEFTRNIQLVTPITFAIIFIVISALVEVNFGTAFRHRSVLLSPIICFAICSLEIIKRKFSPEQKT